MTKKDRSILTSLERVANLPNISLDHLSRIRIDNKGRVWVDEDTIVIVLKGHLIIERELVDICERSFRQPDALGGRINFETRLRLVRALLGDDEFPKTVYDILIDFNRIRNKLAHNLDPKNLDEDLFQFFQRFSTFPDFEEELKDESVPERLNSCTVFLCGMLGSIQRRLSSTLP